MLLDQKFYTNDTLLVAQKLLGTFLVFESPKGLLGGRIVETESYLFDDPAAHSFKGMTTCNQAMFMAFL